MAEKQNSNEYKEKMDSEETVERLDPSSVAGNEVDIKFTDDEGAVDRWFEEATKIDHSIDSLFDEERENFHKGLQDEVQKALSQPEMSKASLFRMRSKEPSETALTGEIAKQKTVEEIWEGPIDESNEVSNRKAVIAICVSIVLIAIAGGWALWQATNDERGNEKNLNALENESKEKEKDRHELSEEIRGVSEVIDRYFSAITVNQKIECIFLAESFKDDIEAYYQNNEGVKTDYDYCIESIYPIYIHNEEIWEVLIKNKDYPSDESTSYYVRKDSDGEYKVDWKAAVAFQDNDIIEFVDKRSKDAQSFKFVVEPLYKMSTFNWGFTDAEYKVLRLKFPNSDKVFWGYVKKNSPQSKKLYRYITGDLNNSVLNKTMKHEFILKIRFLEDSPKENDQYVLIEDVISRKWINIEK